MKVLKLAIAFCFLSLPGFSQGNKKLMKQLIDDNMKFAAQQYKVLMKNVPPDSMPRSYDAGKNKIITSNTKWWCSGFYPGTLWVIYDATKDPELKKEAESRLAILEKEKTNKGTHDLGFMMFCSFGNAYSITHKPEYKDVIFTAASSLATRYRPSIQSIQSWDSSKNFKCPVIIDNMMNLELLEWVTKNGGDALSDHIVLNHSYTTFKKQFSA